MILTCADANDALTALHWASWATGQAFGTGTEKVNTCTPDCADGKFVSYPALITLWRPEPLPGHPGVRYFTRITRIYPANRPPLYNCQGKHTCYPQTSTFDLRNPHLADRPAPSAGPLAGRIVAADQGRKRPTSHLSSITNPTGRGHCCR